MRLHTIIVTLIATAISAVSATAAGRLIPFQARLTDASKQPLNGVFEIMFVVYDAPLGGTALWSETHATASVIEGQLNVLLGGLQILDAVQFTQPKYLGITVGASGKEMVPRHQLVPAFHAVTADIALSLPPGLVGATEIANGAIGASKIAAGAIGASQIAAGAVGASQIANRAVGTSQIAFGAVGPLEIAPGAVNAGHIQGGAVGAPQIAFGAVGAPQIAFGAVRDAAIAANAVYSYHVLDGGLNTKDTWFDWTYHATTTSSYTTPEKWVFCVLRWVQGRCGVEALGGDRFNQWRVTSHSGDPCGMACFGKE